MAGLDNIKHFEDGGSTSTPPTDAAILATQGKGGLNLSGKIALDPTQTNEILRNMQNIIDERSSPLNAALGGINKAYAISYGPQSMIAYQRQQDLQDKETMDYRQQMAAYRAAEAQAANEAKRYATANATAGDNTTGGVTTGGINIPPEQLAREALLGTNSEKLASRNEFLKTLTNEKIKHDTSVELDKIVKFPVGDRLIDMTLRRAIKLAEQNPDLPESKAILAQSPTAVAAVATPSTSKMKAELLKATEVPLEGLPTPFVAQESSSGKADTSKPNYAGAQGPMQVTKDTFEAYKAKGIIPKDYDLNDPAHGYASGILILNDLHKKYNGDINKVAAEYYGGAGAINADGSINVGNKPKPDPKTGKTGPTVGEYINDIRKRMDLPPADLTRAPADVVKGPTAPAVTAPAVTAPAVTAPAVTAPAVTAPAAPSTPLVTSPTLGAPAVPVATNIPQMKAQLPKGGMTSTEIEQANAQEQERSKQNFVNIGKQEEKFLERADDSAIAQKQANNDYLKVIINKWGGDKLIAGTLNEPTWGNAIAKAIEQGVTTPGGAISMPAITEVLMRTARDSSPEKIEANLEIARLLGQRIMDVVAQSKGSSSDKDWIAFKAIAGSAANGWDALHKIQQYDENILNRDKQEKELYKETYNGKSFDYGKHLMNPKRTELYNETAKKLSEINRSSFKPQQTPVRPSDVPAGAMYDPPSKTWWWKDSSGKDKHN